MLSHLNILCVNSGNDTTPKIPNNLSHKNRTIFESLQLLYVMMQKCDPYIKVFSTLSEVRMLSCILSQLNILCTSLVKPCYSKNDDSPVIHRAHVTAILRVLRRVRFHRSGVFHISKRSVLYRE